MVINTTKGELSTNDDFGSTASSCPVAKWLISFDNADDPLLLGNYWPQGNSSALVKSRDLIAECLFSVQSSVIDLDLLSLKEGGCLPA